ncbi:MAG: hypothetical protein KFF50_11930 [Desulfatitalea sp.]|nr:hypothetical protein [Desulfatitalea sp.]
MIGNRFVLTVFTVALLALFAAVSTAAHMDKVPRMSKETLKEMLHSPDVVILDIRIGIDWNASEFKIQGSERRDPRQLDTWKDQLDKEKTVVVYCA